MSKTAIFGSKEATTIGTWNIRTIKTEDNLQILTREMKRYRCDIIGLSETHRLGTEEFIREGYKFIGQGRADAIHRSGVGFLLNSKAQSALLEYKPVSDRVICITLRTAIGTATVIQVYAPTSAATDVNVM